MGSLGSEWIGHGCSDSGLSRQSMMLLSPTFVGGSAGSGASSVDSALGSSRSEFQLLRLLAASERRMQRMDALDLKRPRVG